MIRSEGLSFRPRSLNGSKALMVFGVLFLPTKNPTWNGLLKQRSSLASRTILAFITTARTRSSCWTASNLNGYLRIAVMPSFFPRRRSKNISKTQAPKKASVLPPPVGKYKRFATSISASEIVRSSLYSLRIISHIIETMNTIWNNLQPEIIRCSPFSFVWNVLFI